ncbi:MAG: TetR/AcrR family transcriptional regulator [Anaerolineaceae bacterium]|nr:TetR/AcrR family transcriptional regulator [Anaerolineaceae bacterium]
MYHHIDLRNTLIEESLKILAQDGENALTLREVARRARVSHTAPYRHFKNKEALLAAIAEEGFRELMSRLEAARERCIGKPGILLEEIAWAYVKFSQDKPDHWRVMFSDLIPNWDSHPSLRTTGLAAYNLLVGTLLDLQKAGIVRPGNAREMAVAGWSTVHGLSLLLIAGQIRLTLGDAQAEELARMCARYFAEGIANL